VTPFSEHDFRALSISALTEDTISFSVRNLWLFPVCELDQLCSLESVIPAGDVFVSKLILFDALELGHNRAFLRFTGPLSLPTSNKVQSSD